MSITKMPNTNTGEKFIDEVEAYRIDKLKRLVKDSNYTPEEQKACLKFIEHFLEPTAKLHNIKCKTRKMLDVKVNRHVFRVFPSKK